MHSLSIRDSHAATAIYVVSFSILMGLLAHVSIPLPFTPVPLTGQTFGVMLAGAVLSAPAAAAAMILYLAQGAAGLPVFSPAGPGGVAQLIGPTGGFLLALPAAAFVIAATKPWMRLPLALVAGEITLFSFGAAWLAAVTVSPVRDMLQAAVLPFLPGEILKGALVLVVAAGFRARHHRR